MALFDNLNQLNDKMKGVFAGLTNLQSGNAAPAAPGGGTVCSCGAQLAAGAKFCPSCGKPTTCANCGAQLGGAKFCPSCGTPAGGAASSPPPPPLQASVPPQPASRKVGDIRKCPACGAVVESFQIRCSSCGHEFSNVQAASSVQAFFDKLDAVEQQALEATTNQKEKNALSSMFDFQSYNRDIAFTRRKVGLIDGYPIPNSKEEILEFLILASSRVKKRTLASDSDEMATNKAWIAKCKQAYNKAQIVLASDKDVLQKIEKIFKDAKIK